MKRPVPSGVRSSDAASTSPFDGHGRTAPARLAEAAAVPPQSRQRESRTQRQTAIQLPQLSEPAGDDERNVQLEEIQRFLVSATSALVPNPKVLNAVTDAFGNVQELLRGVQPRSPTGSTVPVAGVRCIIGGGSRQRRLSRRPRIESEAVDGGACRRQGPASIANKSSRRRRRKDSRSGDV